MSKKTYEVLSISVVEFQKTDVLETSQSQFVGLMEKEDIFNDNW